MRKFLDPESPQTAEMARVTSIIILVATLAVASVGLAGAGVPPPDLLHYQGVLRDASGLPLTQEVDMVFRFRSAEVGGVEILVDSHLDINGQTVTVDNGLFSVMLGAGEVLDGSGPGTYTSLGAVFRDYGELWLSIKVGAETLLPRIRIAASGYALNSLNALNAENLDGRPPSEFLDTSGSWQKKTGYLVIGSDSVEVSAAVAAYTGGAYGGFFQGNAAGIKAQGNTVGGYFRDLDDGSWADLAKGDYGIEAKGNSGGAGGRFVSSGGGEVYLAKDFRGIEAYGTSAGGYFESTASLLSHAHVANGQFGIEASGFQAGGRFEDINGSGWARVGFGDTGIEGSGNTKGGYFLDLDDGGHASVGFGSIGIQAAGVGGGGYFYDSDDSGFALVAYDDYGIFAQGNDAGARFLDFNGSGEADVAYNDYGISARGNSAGGSFSDLDSSAWAHVGAYTYKIIGSGSVSFVQNRPDDSSKVVVYHAPEASEVGVYTRGSARLDNGVAHVSLDPTFQWVSNPDLGLTAHLTPRDTPTALAVEQLSTTDLVVRGPDGSDARFDYMVWGLRIGFEQSTSVQPKVKEAPIPAMTDHRELIAAEPELASYTALERFRTMTAQLEGIDREEIDLSRAADLVSRIHEFDPATDVVERPAALEYDRPTHPQDEATETPEETGESTVGERNPVTRATPTRRAAGVREQTERIAADPPAANGTWLPVNGEVFPGDLLASADEHPGAFRQAFDLADPNVLGVATELVRPGRDGITEVWVAMAGVASVRVDAGYGEILPGDLLVSSHTSGHAMRALEVIPGTVVGKAIDGLEAGTGEIRVLLMPR